MVACLNMHKKEQIIAADEDEDEQFCQEIMNTYENNSNPEKEQVYSLEECKKERLISLLQWDFFLDFHANVWYNK